MTIDKDPRFLDSHTFEEMNPYAKAASDPHNYAEHARLSAQLAIAYEIARLRNVLETIPTLDADTLRAGGKGLE